MIENKGNKVSNDLDFCDCYRHKKKHIHWVFQDDDKRETPYSRARSKPYMNNVTATECNNMSTSHILFGSMHEGELGKLITWGNIKVNRDGKLSNNRSQVHLHS